MSVRTPLRRTMRPGSQTGDTAAILSKGTRAPVTGDITYVLATSLKVWRRAGSSRKATADIALAFPIRGDRRAFEAGLPAPVRSWHW